MKKIFFIAMLLLAAQQIFPCDICGCSSGNYFIGLFPQFRRNFFGIRYSFRSFNSQLAADKTQFSKDFYQTAELWGGLQLGRKWQILAFVPYSINRQNSDDGIKNSKGLGDITLMANYKVLNLQSEGKHGSRITQQLWLGGGLKLPTGKFDADPADILSDANNQPGTGSVDYVLNAMYTYHIDNWGINSSMNYKINSSAKSFQFGNRFNTTAFIFHSISTSKVTFNPNVGLLYENLQANKSGGLKVDDTGGNVLLGAAGLETNFSKVAVGFNAQLPVSQNLSNGQTTTKIRGMIHVTLTL